MIFKIERGLKSFRPAFLASILALLPWSPGAAACSAEAHVKVCINPVWRFHLGQPTGEPFETDYDDSKWEIVSLPHSHLLFTANISGFEEHGRANGWYRRQLQIPAGWVGKKVFLEFQGAMQTTAVWVNGKRVGDYKVSGFDSFGFDITPLLKPGTNQLAICVDNRPNPEIPPDGTKTDYILFGGLYRDVFLHVTDPVHLTFPWEDRQASLRLTLPTVSEKQAVVQVESTIHNDSDHARKCILVTEICDRDGKMVKTMRDEREITAAAEATFTQKSEPIANPHLWSADDPYLYQVHTRILESEHELDHCRIALGIRWVKFDKKQGFFLNGKHLKLIGANYHQTWPFIGNAVPAGLRRRDAEQMKAMGINWVRLSHYPQDPNLLDALDELGIMAVAEPPTWMGKGNSKWMDNLEASFRSMIRRDRNHPSIILSLITLSLSLKRNETTQHFPSPRGFDWPRHNLPARSRLAGATRKVFGRRAVCLERRAAGGGHVLGKGPCLGHTRRCY
jgi:beta-galactosidase